MSSKINFRNFTITDIDEKYCDISEKNISRVNEDIFGKREYVLSEQAKSIKGLKNKGKINNKKIEEGYIFLCKTHNKILSLDEVKNIDNLLFDDLCKYGKKFSKLQSLTKRLYLS